MKQRSIAPVIALLLAATLAMSADRAAAQGIVVEGGVSGIDDRSEPVGSWGAGLLLPLGDHALGSLLFQKWEKGPGDTRREQCGAQGCQGVAAHLLFRVAGGLNTGWFLGGGIDLYERQFVLPGSPSEYRGALSVTGMAARSVSRTLSLYLRGSVSAPAFDLSAEWMHLRAGVAVRVF